MRSFLLENTSFGDENFRIDSHDNITLIVLAIAARDKFREKNLARDEQKVEQPWFNQINVANQNRFVMKKNYVQLLTSTSRGVDSVSRTLTSCSSALDVFGRVSHELSR